MIYIPFFILAHNLKNIDKRLKDEGGREKKEEGERRKRRERGGGGGRDSEGGGGEGKAREGRGGKVKKECQTFCTIIPKTRERGERIKDDFLATILIKALV